MVETAVSLVVVDEEDRRTEHLGVGYQDVEDLRDVPGAVIDRPIRVFGIAGGRDDPGNLRERTVLDIVTELVKQVLGPGQPLRLRGASARDDIYDFRAGAAILEQWRR